MSLADAAESVSAAHGPGPRCGVGFIMGRLDDTERTLLESWLFPAEGVLRKSNRWIADVLAADGHVTAQGRPPTEQVVTHHRQRGCRCST